MLHRDPSLDRGGLSLRMLTAVQHQGHGDQPKTYPLACSDSPNLKKVLGTIALKDFLITIFVSAIFSLPGFWIAKVHFWVDYV